jgi:hypothetical protein
MKTRRRNLTNRLFHSMRAAARLLAGRPPPTTATPRVTKTEFNQRGSLYQRARPQKRARHAHASRPAF